MLGMLRVLLGVPQRFRSGHYEGLLGNFNDDDKDDLIASNGGRFHSSTAKKDEIYTFAETCKSSDICRNNFQIDTLFLPLTLFLDRIMLKSLL